jgi:hypothetical protein
MRLLHYSRKPIGTVRSVAQEGELSRCDKPRGLWLSVEGEDDWRSWCEAEDFADLSAAYCYEVTLAEGANILRITTSAELLDFGREYGFNPYPQHRSLFGDGYGIRWAEVAAAHDGIIIAPYQWPLRLDGGVHWYYGWDCASGVIWNADAVGAIQLRAEPRAAVAA